jgi:hypothetical protein
MTSFNPGARIMRVTDTGDKRDGTANVIRIRPRGMVEVMLDREVGADRRPQIVVVPATELVPVVPDLSHLPAHKRNDPSVVSNYGAWYDLPYPAVPWNTSPGRVHKVVAIHGTMFTGYGSGAVRVVGVTACGKGREGNLELDRDSTSMFPKCKRCWGPE